MKVIKPLRKLIILALILNSLCFADTLIKSDVDITSEAMLKAVQMQSKYEAKEEIRNDQIGWLKIQNSILIICLAATTL